MIGDLSKEHKTDKEYYIVELVFEKRAYFTLWYESDTDGFVLNEEGNCIRAFDDAISARIFADRLGYILAGNATIVCNELVLLNFQNLNCHLLLDFWNIVSDMTNSLSINFLGDHKERNIASLYNKLFYGCNLPAIRKDNADFEPEWSQYEQDLITQIVKEGIKIILENILKM